MIPVSAYSFFRLTFIKGGFIPTMFTLFIFNVTVFFLVASFVFFIAANKPFYKMRNCFPSIVYSLGELGLFMWKMKAVAFYEQQCAKRLKSGYKMYPNILITPQLFLKVS